MQAACHPYFDLILILACFCRQNIAMDFSHLVQGTRQFFQGLPQPEKPTAERASNQHHMLMQDQQQSRASEGTLVNSSTVIKSTGPPVSGVSVPNQWTSNNNQAYRNTSSLQETHVIKPYIEGNNRQSVVEIDRRSINHLSDQRFNPLDLSVKTFPLQFPVGNQQHHLMQQSSAPQQLLHDNTPSWRQPSNSSSFTNGDNLPSSTAALHSQHPGLQNQRGPGDAVNTSRIPGQLNNDQPIPPFPARMQYQSVIVKPGNDVQQQREGSQQRHLPTSTHQQHHYLVEQHRQARGVPVVSTINVLNGQYENPPQDSLQLQANRPTQFAGSVSVPAQPPNHYQRMDSLQQPRNHRDETTPQLPRSMPLPTMTNPIFHPRAGHPSSLSQGPSSNVYQAQNSAQLRPTTSQQLYYSQLNNNTNGNPSAVTFGHSVQPPDIKYGYPPTMQQRPPPQFISQNGPYQPIAVQQASAEHQRYHGAVISNTDTFNQQRPIASSSGRHASEMQQISTSSQAVVGHGPYQTAHVRQSLQPHEMGSRIPHQPQHQPRLPGASYQRFDSLQQNPPMRPVKFHQFYQPRDGQYAPSGPSASSSQTPQTANRIVPPHSGTLAKPQPSVIQSPQHQQAIRHVGGSFAGPNPQRAPVATVSTIIRSNVDKPQLADSRTFNHPGQHSRTAFPSWAPKTSPVGFAQNPLGIGLVNIKTEPINEDSKPPRFMSSSHPFPHLAAAAAAATGNKSIAMAMPFKFRTKAELKQMNGAPAAPTLEPPAPALPPDPILSDEKWQEWGTCFSNEWENFVKELTLSSNIKRICRYCTRNLPFVLFFII